MANLSDAFGTINVTNVGKEFLHYLKTVQGSDKDAYYKLMEVETLNNAKADKDNNLTVDFSTFGRWHYQNNINGYLKGEWMQPSEYTPESHKVAYDNFIKAMIVKNGSIEIEYTDSDMAMDWMGSGGFTMSVEDGELSFGEMFDEQSIDLAVFADLYGYDQVEALEYMYGDEVAGAYDKYVDKCKSEGVEPVEPQNWYDTIYEEV